MGEIPAGTVTLLFTDVEGSTRLLQELGRERYMRALSDQRRLLREAFTSHDGFEVEAQGDSFHFAFQYAPDAVFAAVEAQRALAAHAWEAEPLRVRIGIHTGDPAAHEGVYAGLDVHRAARVMDAGHGGQIMVSQATAELVEPTLPDGIRLRDLGTHRLRDISEPEHLLQLELPDLPQDFPPLRTLTVAPVNVPVAPTPIVGREPERAELRALLGGHDVRLVTITGPGGVGKTRLALEVAHELSGRFVDGVHFVALAPLQEHSLVAAAIARTLGVEEGAERPLLETLQDHLREKKLLLVLDNFEHVSSAAPEIGALAAAAPGLAVLATSRRPLRLQGEHEYVLDPLRLPRLDRLPDPHELARIDAVAFFLERGRAVGRRLDLERDARSIASICVALDGLPLALELAAARLKLLPPADLLDRLGQSLPLLVGGPADAPDRQRTLRATIDWSHGLLSEQEQALFRRLAVFAGGCTLGAAEQVGGADLPTLEALVDASMLRAVDGRQGVRFTTLRVIREYAAELLEESGESEAVHELHLSCFLELARDAHARMTGAEQSEQLARVEIEHDNLRAALAWALWHAPEQALLLTTELQRFYYLRGHSAEGLRAVEEALARTTGAEATLRAKALRSGGTLAEGIGDFVRAREYLEASLRLFRELSDPRELAVTLNNLGAAVTRQADVEAAREYLEESLRLKRELGDLHGVAMSLSNLAMLEARVANFEAARAHQSEALAEFRALGDESAVTNSLIALAEVAVSQGESERARALLDEALALAERVGDRAATVEGLALLARALLAQDELVRAGEAAARGAELACDVDDAYVTIVALEAAAEVLAALLELGVAVGLRATAARVRTEAGAAAWPVEQRRSREADERAREALSRADYERAAVAGSAAPVQEALVSAAARTAAAARNYAQTGAASEVANATPPNAA
jgi:predicted ATPase/class 3 adenylate cyclase